jgi:CRP/FNR family transcriptional regulator, cyclic AMP receptor protein
MSSPLPAYSNSPLRGDVLSSTVNKFKLIDLFKDLSDQQIQAIAPYFFESHYDKDNVIFYERDLPSDYGNRIYFVIKGSVKLVKYSSDGESTIVRMVSVGEFFGVTGVITGQPMPFSAEAQVASTILYIERSNFERLIEQHPRLALKMVADMGKVLWFNYETHNQVVKKTDARVAKIILHHFRRDGHTVTPLGLELNIMLPHDYIASMTGIAYEESVRIVSRLKKTMGCINYLRGGKILITNLAALKQVAQEVEED